MANTHNQKSGKRFLSVWRYLCHVHTNAFSKVDVVVIKKASIVSRQYYRFNAFSTFHTKTSENDKISRRDVSWTLCACYKHTRPRYFTISGTCEVIVFISMRFRPFSTVHANTLCMHFRFDPLLRAFSNWCVFYENSRRVSVDRRPKRIEMYAF